MATTNAARKTKTVADPNAEYESLRPLWSRSRAVCSGERYAKEYDGALDTFQYTNLLLPFSPTMTTAQYDFYKAEAELPGIVAQFSKMIIGGLLRKQPILELPENYDKSINNWIIHEFGQDGSTLASFLDDALKEELQTSRAWLYIDYPELSDPENMTPEEFEKIKPYPVMWKAEDVINWTVGVDLFGKKVLKRVITRTFEERFGDNEFHPEWVDTVKVHELDEGGLYRIRRFEKVTDSTIVQVVNGRQQAPKDDSSLFVLKSVNANIMINGKRMDMIPAWPLNGSIKPCEPILSPIIDKEVQLYNKMSRRNHLLYGAATYTPIIASDISDDEFDDIVAAGLGTWIRLRPGDTATVLETPTAALQDMDRAIASSIEEMAKMGIRMLSPEVDQSGVALEIRNAAQTAQLGTLNTKVSNTLKQIITFMINWRFDSNLDPNEIKFQLSSDFNPSAVGPDWMRLATEWYQAGLIPRAIWLEMLKHNDMLSPEYDDEKGMKEIQENQDMLFQRQNEQYAEQIQLGQELAPPESAAPPSKGK